MSTTFKFKKPEADDYEWNNLEIGDGMLNLPKTKQWCLFEFWQCFPMRHKDGSIERIKAYGHLIKHEGRKSVIYLPLYEMQLNVCKVARWKYVDMPEAVSLKKPSETGV